MSETLFDRMRAADAVMPLQPPRHFRVKTPPFLGTRSPQEYVMEVMRAVAQAANECGIEGSRITSIMFDNSKGPEAEILLEVESAFCVRPGADAGGTTITSYSNDPQAPRALRDARQGPAITIMRDSLMIDCSQATTPRSEFSWEYLDRKRAELAARGT